MSNQTENENGPSSKITPRINPVWAGFIGIFGSFFLFQFVGGLITLIIIGPDAVTDPVSSDINAIRIMNIAGQILFMLLPALLFSKIFFEDITFLIRFKKPDLTEVFIFIGGLILLIPLLQSYLYVQNHFIEVWAAASPFIADLKGIMDKFDKLLGDTYVKLFEINSFIDPVILFFTVALVPAVCEETLFRGYIQKSFEFKIAPFFSALLTAFFFASFHFNPYGFIPLIGLGFYFGYAAYKSGSILIPMLLHFLNNFVALVLYMLYGSEELIDSKTTGNIEIEESLPFFIELIILFALFILFVNFYYRRKLKGTA